MLVNFVHQPLTSSSIGSLVSEIFDDFQSMQATKRSGLIPVDVKEHEDRYELVAEVPGVSKEDLRIKIENGMLTIRGERKPIVNGSKAKLVHSEIPTGLFERTFVVPRDAEAGKFDAQLSQGILKLTMPKAEHSLPREITVK